MSIFVKGPLIYLIFCYRRFLSPLLGPRCRFYPSCSEYALISLSIYSLPRAFSKISFRLLRCNQFSKGGVDQP